MKNILKITGIWLIVLLIVACTNKDKHEHHDGGTEIADTSYTCPMHPQIVESAPGSCPICGMDLVPVKSKPHRKRMAVLCLAKPK